MDNTCRVSRDEVEHDRKQVEDCSSFDLDLEFQNVCEKLSKGDNDTHNWLMQCIEEFGHQADFGQHMALLMQSENYLVKELRKLIEIDLKNEASK